MTNRNRLNPNATSRPTLRNLETKGILQREKVGIRNIIRATTNTVDEIGFDLHELHGWAEDGLMNFHPAVRRATGWVSYNGGRAQITATQGMRGYENHVLDVARHFPVNDLATDLLNQACTKNGSFDKQLPMQGDAILITDIRAHWVFSSWRRGISAQDLEDFDRLLTSPRDFIRRGNGRWPWIFFRTEPCEQDIIALMLRWA